MSYRPYELQRPAPPKNLRQTPAGRVVGPNTEEAFSTPAVATCVTPMGFV